MEIINRRTFLNQTGIATAGSLLLPGFLARLQASPFSSAEGRVLVVVQLSGGNDGLNTFAPIGNDMYHRMRPGIGLSTSKLIPLNDTQGMHPSLEGLQPAFDRGELLLFNAVGYPNPNRSHFRSMDIWQTASTKSSEQRGWLGRYLDAACSGEEPAGMKAVEFGHSLSLALKGEKQQGLAVDRPDRLYRAVHSPLFDALYEHDTAANDMMGYMYKTIHNTRDAVEAIYQNLDYKKATGREYPQHPFAQQMMQIEQLIGAGAPVQVYYLSLSGFDTHVRQEAQHKRLLEIYGQSLRAFRDQLIKKGQWDRTLVFTFSEFGRRVKENASGGTDHGAANNCWLLGGNLKSAGVYNGIPDLDKLKAGDVPYQIDFRSIYATLLQHWLDTRSSSIVDPTFTPIPGLV